MTEKILPQINTEVKTAVKKQLESGCFFSFTTEAWSRDDGGASLLSLTAHWITGTFARKSAVLEVLPLDESHIGQHLAKKYLEMLAEWEIRLDQAHAILCDNAANMDWVVTCTWVNLQPHHNQWRVYCLLMYFAVVIPTKHLYL